jgi:hypothetical protein
MSWDALKDILSPLDNTSLKKQPLKTTTDTAKSTIKPIVSIFRVSSLKETCFLIFMHFH